MAKCYDRSGSSCDRLFYEAPVEMPILSVTELSKEGHSGSEIRFRAKDGEIVGNATGKKCRFVSGWVSTSCDFTFPNLMALMVGWLDLRVLAGWIVDCAHICKPDCSSLPYFHWGDAR